LQYFRFALYRDNYGVPGEQVAETRSDAIAPGDAATWRCADSALAPINPGTYWIMLHTGSNAGVLRYYYDGPANWYGNYDEFDDGSSDTFGTGGAGEGTMSLRVEYLTLTETKIAGKTTVGPTVSGPMSANFKRGSSFQLTEKADLGAMSIYVDSLGGATGSQTLT